MAAKISMKKFTEAVPPADDNIIVKLGDGDKAVDVIVKSRLTGSEEAGYIDDVVSMGFIKDENNEDNIIYAPNLIEFGIRYYFFVYFTNVDISNSYETAKKFIEGGAYDNIMRNLVRTPDRCFFDYFNDLRAYVKSLVDFKKEQLIRADKAGKILNAIGNVAETIAKRIEEMPMETLLEFANQHPELEGELEPVAVPDVTDKVTIS